MNEIIKNLHKNTVEGFKPFIEDLAKKGFSEKEIVEIFSSQMRIKANNYYSKGKEPESIGKILGKITISKESTSKAEYIFYDLLLKEDIPFKYQYKIGEFRADFLCGKSIVIELDGPQHNEIKDQLRDKYLEKMGYKTIRIPLKILFDTPDEIITHIKIMVLYE